MNPDLLQIAAQIVNQTDREHPADLVLRNTLKARRGLTRAEAGQISEAVFAHYRWLGWLGQEPSAERRIPQALELAQRFAREPESFSDEDLLAHAVPAWTTQETAVTPAWARTLQREPVLWLRARPGTGRQLARKLGGCRPFGDGPLADSLAYQGQSDLFRNAEFHAGRFEVQDLSSQAVGTVCAPQPGQTWWDACAGEGGKTLHLSDLMANQGLIWASDRAEWRLRRLKQRAGRAGVFNYRSAPWDGSSRLPTRTRFDGVLVDAPCSGLGTWHRNPHARWTTTPQDVHELGLLQQRLLAHAATAVKPGGRLVYAVCTLTTAETETVASQFERQSPSFRPLDLADPLDPAGPVALRLWLRPEQCQGNGMFIAAWERRRE